MARVASRRERARPLIMVLRNHSVHSTCLLQDVVGHLARGFDVLLVDADRPARIEYRRSGRASVARMPFRLPAAGLPYRIAAWLLASLVGPRFIVLLPGINGGLSILLEWGGHTTIRCLTATDVSGTDDLALAASVWTTSGLVFLDDRSVGMADERCFALAARDYVVSHPLVGACDAAAAVTRAPHAMRLADAISAIGNEGARLRASEGPSRKIIMRSGIFDGRFACGVVGAMHGRRKKLRLYLATSRLAAPRKRAHTGRMIRRPAIGFNPLIYAADAPSFDEAALDPLADFIRRGQPTGRWTHDVVSIEATSPARQSRLKVAIQGHFYYEELFPDLLVRLGRNNSDVDLYVTTSDSRKAKAIEAAKRPPNVALLDVRVVPNRGRDIGALLSGYDHGQWQGYDVLGHIHGKRCSYRESAFGDEWRSFMWGALIGDAGASMDAVLDRFASDQMLGLIFPEDPLLHGMDGNQEMADRLADDLRIKTPLPAHFEFPMGSMYLARPKALADLWALGLSWDDYPTEPIPNDGTLLHALERLPTFLAEKNGYRFATVHVRNSYRA